MTQPTDSRKPTLKQAIRLFENGDLHQAEAFCGQILEHEPDNGAVCHLLGVIEDRRGRPGPAVQLINRAISRDEGNPLYYNNLGNAYRNLGQHDDAVAAYGQALSLNPAFAAPHNNMGNVLREQGRFLEAIESFKKALQLKPDQAETYLSLGRVFHEIGIRDSALEAFRGAIHCRPDYARAHLYLGQLLNEIGHLAEAESRLRKALALQPDSSDALNSLASVLEQAGKSDEALTCYRKALTVNPGFYEVYYFVASLINRHATRSYYAAKHHEIDRIEELLRQKNLRPEDEMYLHFALAEMYDNCNKFAAAFDHCRQGNSIQRAGVQFSIPRMREYVDRIIKTFSREFYRQHPFRGSESPAPVFVVGLPRSGKSLVEQMIAVHDQVFGGKEITRLARMITRDLPIRQRIQEEFPASVARMDNTALRNMAVEYEEFLATLAGSNSKRVSNTMPNNVYLLGMIGLLFPGARIIHCRRDPLDNCLAVYLKHFSRSQAYAYDLQEIGFYYRQHEKLMAHWRDVLPLAVYEVQYEDLVARPEECARGLVEFLGLNWNDACTMAFRDNFARDEDDGSDGPVQIIHDRFVGWAKNYGKLLAPLEKSLQEHVP